jgi:hypothetical protein
MLNHSFTLFNVFGHDAIGQHVCFSILVMTAVTCSTTPNAPNYYKLAVSEE